jgi:hypothetical protein
MTGLHRAGKGHLAGTDHARAWTETDAEKEPNGT